MRTGKIAILPLCLVSFVPTISILFTMKFSDDQLISSTFFIFCKIWMLFFPAFWYIKVEGNNLTKTLPNSGGITAAVFIGFSMSIIIILTWFLFMDTIDTESMISQLESTGLTDIRLYVAAMIYWIFLNSLLEEYVFRWFVTTKAIDLLGNDMRGIALSALLFTLHHAIALHMFGFAWWQTLIACIGLMSGAAIWSWLYLRYRSILVCWASHAICDVAVFGLGYLIIFHE